MAVTGGDGLHNETASITFEAAAPSRMQSQSGSREATAVLSTLKLLDAPQYATHPVTLHASVRLTERIAGVQQDQTLFREVRHAWSASSAQRQQSLWISAPRYCPGRHSWMRRAEALAEHCQPPKVWGEATTLLPQAAVAPPPAGDECSVCYEEFPDPFPTPGAHIKMP